MIGPISYIGGKNRLAKHIISLIPKHTTFVEPFVGGGQVFFHKTPSEVEILNDLSDDVVNFFRICQSHHQELVRYLTYMIVGRSWFNLLYKTDPAHLTDIQKAARFFYLQKNTYAGLVARRNFALRVIQPSNFNPDRIPELLEATAKRLHRVQIESLPYQTVIQKTDRESTFFYLDPPYWNKRLYNFNFKEEDFKELSNLLTGIRGKFLLSINDDPAVREIFSSFGIEEVSLNYTAQRKAGKRYTELLIRNY